MAFPTGREVPHAAVTRRVTAKLKRMTPAEAMESFVAAGIYTPDGRLTSAYGGTARSPGNVRRSR